jgi:hypothetical protein
MQAWGIREVGLKIHLESQCELVLMVLRSNNPGNPPIKSMDINVYLITVLYIQLSLFAVSNDQVPIYRQPRTSHSRNRG